MYFLDFYHKIISFIFDIVKLNLINYYQMRESNQVSGMVFAFLHLRINAWILNLYLTSLNMHCVLHQSCQINKTELNTIFKMIILNMQ